MSQQIKYYGYTGDLVLQDTDLLELNYFSEIKKICIDESISLIVNLEFIKISLKLKIDRKSVV